MKVPWKIVLSLLLVAGVTAFVLWVRSRPTEVEAAVVERGRARSLVEEEGRTHVVELYRIAAPVAGRLLRVELEPGDAVEEGQVVARMDPLGLESEVEQALARLGDLREQVEGVERKKPKEAELESARLRVRTAEEAVEVARREAEQARATRDQAERDLDREQLLLRKETGTRQEYENALLRLRVAEQKVRAAELQRRIREIEVGVARQRLAVLEERLHDFDWEKAALRERMRGVEAELRVLRDDLERARIPAPVSGRVLRRLQESRRVVSAGEPILEIGDLSRMEVEADFLSEDVAHMREGMKVEIFGRALGDRVLESRIARIHAGAFEKVSSLGVEQQRATVVAPLPEPPGFLGDAFRVEMRVVLEEHEDALLVPEAALFHEEGEWYAMRVARGRTERVRVRTGLRDGRVREVLEGLREGDRVVLHPDPELEGGDPVSVR